jgi:hypothetical protein
MAGGVGEHRHHTAVSTGTIARFDTTSPAFALTFAVGGFGEPAAHAVRKPSAAG